MAITAKIKYLRISPRKVRMVADLIRYKPVAEAEAILRFTTKKASKPLLKLLDSALANAKNNLKKDTADLYVSEIFVDEGPKLKRSFPRSRGTANMIQKKSSHVTLVLEEKTAKENREGVVKSAAKKTKKQQKK